MMNFKRNLLAVCCASVMILGGCSSQNGIFISYSDINLLKSSDVQDVVSATKADAFTKNIAVISGDGTNGGTKASHVISSESDTEDSATDESTASDDTFDTPSADNTADGGTADHSTVQDVPDPNALSDTPALLVCKSTNEVIYYNDAFKEIAPASLTKLMTALVALKYGVMSDEVTLTAEMNYDITPAAQTCGFLAGDKVTLETLLRSMIVYSGNETANAIAVHVGGNISHFVEMMNNEAARLGAVNTHFSNTNGLDIDNHYSSGYDLYLIFNECMKYDIFVKAMETAELEITYTDSSNNSRTAYFPTTNYYLKGQAVSPEGVTVYGGKTGTTDNAGACLICYALDTYGNEYIAVSMGNQSKDELYSQMNKILSKIQN